MPVKYLVFNIAVMEELTLTTPSILFSAISLIMLAYTNRFLAYAQVIRNLKGEHENRPSAMTKLQLDNLRKRLYMARSMQIYGVISLLLCVVCTFYLYRSTNFGRLHVRCGFVAVGDFIGNFRERDIDFGEGVGI